MKQRLLFLLAAFSLSAYPQAWSTFLDPSRAIDWTSAGFTIPNYTSNCPTQPTLTANSAAAAGANTTSIQNALASCDAAHNVVNIPAGTYYVAGWTYGAQGKQVVRGAGPNATTIIFTAQAPCLGLSAGVCMIDGDGAYDNSGSTNPPGGTRQCLWTAGYTQGTTTITLSSCAGAPPLNKTLVLDQANDTSDTGGIYMCGGYNPGCTVEPNTDAGGRTINGVVHDLQQVVYVTGVTPLGGGSYSVNITPGIYANNFRSGQAAGAWWPGFVQNDGLENLTIDGTAIPNANLEMFNCYQCWARNIRSLYGGNRHAWFYQSAQSVIRDSYFYGAQGTGSTSYGIQFNIASGNLVENNIFQQVVSAIMFGVGTGNVIGYNYDVRTTFDGTGSNLQAPYWGHGSGNQMGLWEGNNLRGVWTDDTHGSSSTGTVFRNMLSGWQRGKTNYTMVVPFRSWHRAQNVVGNVLGQPLYHTTYEAYSTSTTGGVNTSTANASIYELGFSDYGGQGICTAGPVVCDPLVRSTLMRWGNWDTVSNATRWNSAEASPSAVPYVNANFTSSYFSSLPHTLPASLYYSSKPSWWPAGKAWPLIGPDIVTGNLGICSGGTYDGAQATTAGQCTGGTLTSAATSYASHATTIPAQDCYLNTMGGPPDGSGSVLKFDASLCYGGSSQAPAPVTGLTATVR